MDNAAEVLNLEYLRSIARDPQDLVYSTDPQKALAVFAFEFVEAANENDQNDVLGQLLERVTHGHSANTNEQVLEYLAGMFRTNVQGLRRL